MLTLPRFKSAVTWTLAPFAIAAATLACWSRVTRRL
jgi:hypothetical protein